jgi:vacuolar protein sorting-associated protein 29
MLVPNKMKYVLCTGNINREQHKELCTLAPNVHVTKGDFDDDPTMPFPESLVVQVGQFKIALIHGHQLVPCGSQDAQARMRRKLSNADIIVSGHTHKNEVSLLDGHYHINPGSITGSYSALTPDVTPSFILLAIQDDKLTCYVYELKPDGEVEVSKTEFTKPTPSSSTDGTESGGTNPALLQSLLA